MEIEMKALVNEDQISKLMSYMNDETTFLIKSDNYFSFNGIEPKLPKDIIRIRKEKETNAFNMLKLDDRGFNSGISARNIRDVLLEYSGLASHWNLNYNSKILLTVKKKNTDSYGIERNEETEGELSSDAESAFLKTLEIANFKSYFLKTKRSFSFYIDNMHAELVSVNGIGPYLEVEYIVDKNSDINKAVNSVKSLFSNILDITEFDKRDWPTIIEQESK